ncbi:MAG TPA: tetratricopeptide repeat protein [Gemmatimonadaceae bacterium]|jgi:tetratricopeptide (TPR) repeat protein
MAKAGSRRARKKTAPSDSTADIKPVAFATSTTFVPPLSRTTWIGLVIALIATFIAFAPALRAPFAFDDVDSIPKNPTIEQIATSFSPPARLAVSSRPLVNFSLALNYAMAGASSTTVYHATNVLLHLLCGLLLFGAIRRTLAVATLGEWANENANTVGLISAALWLLHPIQTEAVDYTIQRTELLVSLCYLATLFASIRSWDAATPPRRRGWLWLGVVACFAGMASKEVMVTAPLLVVLYDRAFRVFSWREVLDNRSRRWFYAGLAASWVLLAYLVAGGGRADSAGFALALPWYRYLYSQGWAVAHYLLLMFWPSDLRFDYGFAAVQGIGGLIGGVIVLALAIPALVVAVRTGRWWLAFLVLWFLVILAPSSSILPIQTEIAAERRVYLASAGVVVGIVIAGTYALRAHRRLFLGIAAATGIVLFGLTMRRSALYANPEALWRDALAKAPDNPRAYDNLASVIYEKDRNRVDESDSLWARGLRVDSTYMTIWSNLAQIRVDKGRTADARALLERAVRINPDYVDATRRLGTLLATQGDNKSIPYLERMANSAQVTDESLVALAQAYLNANRPDDAIAALRRALTLNPRRADALSYLGAMLAQRGQFDQAMPLLESAVANGDRNAMTFALLSFGYVQSGRGDDGFRMAQQAAAVGSTDEQVYLLLGRAMMPIGRLPEADAYFAQAVKAAPNDPEPVTRLGVVKAARGDMPAAVNLFKQALKIAPGYPPAEQALAKTGTK